MSLLLKNNSRNKEKKKEHSMFYELGDARLIIVTLFLENTEF